VLAAHRFDNDKRRRADDHHRQRMLTPAYVLEPIRQALGGVIGLDPCTETDNPTGAERFYHLPDDGCALPWDAATVFCNPPYGEARGRWVRRCIEEGRSRAVALLIPAHTETRIFQEALAAMTSVVLIAARVRFGVVRANGRQEAASHGSAIFGFGANLSSLSSIGTVLMRPSNG
jgi:hypothetical protein